MTRPHLTARTILLTLMLVGAAAGAAGLGVAARRVPLLPGLSGCRLVADHDDRARCVAGRSGNLIRTLGPRQGLKAIEDAATADVHLMQVCHMAMHQAGRRSGLSLTPRNVRELTADRGDCHTGFLHGIIEDVIGSGDASTIRTASQLCASLDYDGRHPRTTLSCAHGVGHGVRRQDELKTATSTCMTAFDRRIEQTTCMHGVFMEDMWANRARLSPQTLTKPCDDVTPAWVAITCYENVVNKANVLDMSPASIAAVCARRVPTGTARDRCMMTLGQNTPPDRIDVCEDLDGNDARNCMTGFFAGEHMWGMQLTRAQANGVCRTKLRRHRSQCESIVQEEYAVARSSTKRAAAQDTTIPSDPPR